MVNSLQLDIKWYSLLVITAAAGLRLRQVQFQSQSLWGCHYSSRRSQTETGSVPESVLVVLSLQQPQVSDWDRFSSRVSPCGVVITAAAGLRLRQVQFQSQSFWGCHYSSRRSQTETGSVPESVLVGLSLQQPQVSDWDRFSSRVSPCGVSNAIQLKLLWSFRKVPQFTDGIVQSLRWAVLDITGCLWHSNSHTEEARHIF